MSWNYRPQRAARGRRHSALRSSLGGSGRAPQRGLMRRNLSVERFEHRILLDSNGVIAGTKFRDLTGDGVSPDDVPLAGTSIQLLRDNGDGVLTAADTLVDTEVTNALGQYIFTGLSDGTYFVREVLPAGAVQTGGPAFYTIALSGIGPVAVTDVAIDGFDSPATPASYLINNSDPDPTLILQTAPTIIGGQRDLLVDVLGVSGPVSATGDIGGGSYIFASSAPGTQATLQYDGLDASAANAMLLPNVNFTTGGNDRIRLDFLSLDSGLSATMSIRIRLTDSTGGTAVFTGNIPDSAGAQSFIAQFSSFVTAGGFDFTDVTSMEVVFNEAGVQDIDFELQLITLTQGENTGGFNFTNFFDNTISGRKFEDITGNGFSADDIGLGGTTIELYLDDGDGTFEPGTGDTLVDTTVSAANGTYSFTNLAPGRYFVREIVPPNAEQTAGPEFYNINLVGDANSANNNFGNFRFGTIAGKKVGDVTGNGVSADDVPMPGVTIELYLDDGDNVFEPGAGDTLVDSKLTDASGNYAFANLGPGRYFVREIVPPGFVQTSAPDFYNILLTSNANDNDNDFANRPPASSISGFVYIDISNDGIFDAVESPIPGVQVRLTGTNIFGLPVNLVTLTDVNGFYIFSNLLPGNYAILETQPDGFIDGIDTIGTPGGTAGNDIFANIILPGGFDGLNNNFGELGMFPNKTQLLASSLFETTQGGGGGGNGGGDNGGAAGVATTVIGTEASTVAVYDPRTARFYINGANAGGNAALVVQYGAAGWIPLSGDWDGDGIDTIGMFDPVTATFYLRNSNTSGNPDFTPFQFGNTGWIPVVGDWDGNGTDTIGVFNATNGTFYLRNSNSSGVADAGAFQYGALNFRPVAGDWDGDGIDTIGVTNGIGVYYLRNSNTSGAPDAGQFVYGNAGFRSIIGDWDADGKDSIGVYDPGTMTFYLRNSNTSGPPDIVPFVYGSAGFTATAGKWFSTMVAAGGPAAGSAPRLSQEALNTMVDAAINRWAGAGLSAAQQAKLRSVSVSVANLSGNNLAVAIGQAILVDADAAGYGWFVDRSAMEDSEFNVLAGDTLLATRGPAAHRMDLLTVLAHELGHALGLEDLNPLAAGNNLMSRALSAGERRTPTANEVDALFGG